MLTDGPEVGRPRDSRRLARMVAAGALTAASMFLVQVERAAGQAITLTEPEGWIDGRGIVVPAGKTLRIKGVASHPSGVVKVLVDGVESYLTPDPEIPNLVVFEAMLAAGAEDREVLITILPRESRPFVKRYGIAVAAPPAAPDPAETAKELSADPPAISRSPGPPTTAQSGRTARATTYSPRKAALQSAFIPGLGQFTTGRPAIGLPFLAAGAGSIAFGVMSTKTTVECLARTSGDDCPPGQVRSEQVERPYLLAALGGAVVIAAISAFDAYRGAERANGRVIGSLRHGASTDGAALRFAAPAITYEGGIGLALIRLRF